MKRRDFIRMLCAAGISAPFAPLWLRSAEAAAAPYAGDLLIFVNTQGGWDPAQFCDPKGDLRTDFDDADIVTAGNLRYAPLSFNNNPYAFDFFDRYHDRMVVIQGVNMQTNAHGPGITNAFQGSFASGFPTLSAAFAAAVARELPMSYMVTGNYRSTGGLLPYTAVSQADLIASLALPNKGDLNNGLADQRIPPDIFAMVDAARRARLDRILADEHLMPRRRQLLQYFSSAVDGAQAVENLGTLLPPDGFQTLDEKGSENDLVKQADIILHAMAAGITAAADAEFLDNRFDSHADHSLQQGEMLAHLVYGIRFLWDRAAAIDARVGSNISDRLVIVVNSDFGRSPAINSDGGTDHWPTSSVIVMRKDFASNGIGNRAVGYSTNDGRYLPGRINPATLAIDETNGVEVTSAHVHRALRTHLGIVNAPVLSNVGFPGIEDISLFNPAYSTPQS